MSEEMNFESLARQEFPFPFEGKNYVLKEASDKAKNKWRGAQLQGARLVDGKLHANIERIAESESLLVSLCLFTEDGKVVPLSVVQEWPARVVKFLFEKAKAISQLDELEKPEDIEKRIAAEQKKLDGLRNGKAEDEAKNSPFATMTS